MQKVTRIIDTDDAARLEEWNHPRYAPGRVSHSLAIKKKRQSLSKTLCRATTVQVAKQRSLAKEEEEAFVEKFFLIKTVLLISKLANQ